MFENSAKIVEKTASLPHDFLNDRLINNAKSICEVRQQNDAQTRSATQKMFKDFFQINKSIHNKNALKMFVSPQKAYNLSCLQPPFRNQIFTSRHKCSSYDNSNTHTQLYNNSTRSITPNKPQHCFSKLSQPKISLTLYYPSEQKFDQKNPKLPTLIHSTSCGESSL